MTKKVLYYGQMGTTLKMRNDMNKAIWLHSKKAVYAFVLGTGIVAAVVLAGISLVFHGVVSADHMITGAVTSGFILLLVFPFISWYARRWKGVESQINFLYGIVHSLVEAPDFDLALQLVLSQVCQTVGWEYGEAWIPRPDRSVLDCSPACYMGTDKLKKFRQVTRDMTFAPGVGLPGRVWVSGQSIWVPDVSKVPETFFAWSRPVISYPVA